MITRKLNPRVYDSLLVLLDAVRLYRVYRRLDTLLLYLYYELLIYAYCIYLNKSRADIKAWARINAEVQHSKVNRRLYKMQKGLI